MLAFHPVSPHDLFVDEISVVRSYRKRGVASALLDEASRKCVGNMYLHTETARVNFYEDRGFERVVDASMMPYTPNDDCVCMKRPPQNSFCLPPMNVSFQIVGPWKTLGPKLSKRLVSIVDRPTLDMNVHTLLAYPGVRESSMRYVLAKRTQPDTPTWKKNTLQFWYTHCFV